MVLFDAFDALKPSNVKDGINISAHPNSVIEETNAQQIASTLDDTNIAGAATNKE